MAEVVVSISYWYATEGADANANAAVGVDCVVVGVVYALGKKLSWLCCPSPTRVSVIPPWATDESLGVDVRYDTGEGVRIGPGRRFTAVVVLEMLMLSSLA